MSGNLTGGLYLWHRDVETDVRIVMRAEGLTDTAAAACKQWARRFIQQRVPWWSPGNELRWTERQMIGAAFVARLAAAKRAQKREGTA